MRTLEAFSV